MFLFTGDSINLKGVQHITGESRGEEGAAHHWGSRGVQHITGEARGRKVQHTTGEARGRGVQHTTGEAGGEGGMI